MNFAIVLSRQWNIDFVLSEFDTTKEIIMVMLAPHTAC